MDERIIRKIDALVIEGVKDTREMKRNLNVHVKQQILSKDEIQPSPSNRRFFPKPSDIRSHMYRASIKKKKDSPKLTKKMLYRNTNRNVVLLPLNSDIFHH